ncbi:hydantoinase/oxoprolinase family protein [Rhodococcus sp. KBS0724]|uniref:hydantoinase/oxoprolinase family protein n=1 Tax=Rhodococcus sp. KBS0724 TaxID=1179674 RepID=UPI00110D67B9|nr:hydantoinase/oxoprolinase family protein [Rhodococcus sp. KBS0724]TSD40313.1 hydantoinase/oxoprolinase family protein [Rhodococcus sp. KBS0724]
MYRIGIDIGGTFTDLAAVDERGRIVIAKSSSTPHDPSEGLLEGLNVLAAELGLDRESLLKQTERIVHGTTVATNALLESKGAKVALLTTEGHRDIIEMREGLKDDRYRVRMAPPRPLVERTHRIGVKERIRADGTASTPLTAENLNKAVEAAAELGVDAIAVCYLHSYKNAEHEIQTGEALAAKLPDTYISLSSEVLPQIKEFERVWTTIVNAYVGPVLSNYLNRLSEKLIEAGYSGDVMVMHSHGGVAPIVESSRLAAGAVLSGPAGGIAAATFGATLLDQPDLITFDVGGTSTDIALLQDGEAALASNKKVGIANVALPTLDIHTLGAGGGSVARVRGKILHVGPESAGAYPGPAAYGNGGTGATVTDANVVLGYLHPSNFLGGRMTLDAKAAHDAVGLVADQLGTSVIEAAEGISKIVNTTMAEGIRLVSVRRGVDPRKFALMSFGGAAGLHVTEVARLLDIKRVFVPNVAAVLSAWGMLASDLRYEMVRSHVSEASAMSTESLREILGRMEADGRSRLVDFHGDVLVRYALDMRYGEQITEISVPIDDVDLHAEDAVDQIVDRFHKRHDELYAHSAPDQEVVIVNARVAVVGKLPELHAAPLTQQSWEGVSESGTRRIYLDGWRDVPVFKFDGLIPGAKVDGPAIIESPTTTVLLHTNEAASVTPHGWLDIAL